MSPTSTIIAAGAVVALGLASIPAVQAQENVQSPSHNVPAESATPHGGAGMPSMMDSAHQTGSTGEDQQTPTMRGMMDMMMGMSRMMAGMNQMMERCNAMMASHMQLPNRQSQEPGQPSQSQPSQKG